MSASSGTAPNLTPGGTVAVRAIRHRYQAGQLKPQDGSWYARFYDEVSDGNGEPRSKERWKKLGRIEDYPRERDILPIFEGFMQAVNDRLMGAVGPDPILRVYIEQNYLPSLRLERKTIRGYKDTWNLHWKERIRDLAFGQLHPDVAFRLLKEIADQDDISKTTLQRVKAFMSGVYTHAREQGDFRGANPVTGLRLQKIKARRAKKMPFNSLAETLAYIKVVDGLRAKTAITTAGFAGLTVSELQGLDWKDRYDGQWHVERKVVEGGRRQNRRYQDCGQARRRTDYSVSPEDHRQILEKCGMSRRRGGLWQMDEQSEARPHHPSVKEKGDEVERVARLSPWPGHQLARDGSSY